MISKARLKLLRTLRRREARIAAGIYLVEGRRLVDEALLSGAAVEEVLVTEAFASAPAGADLVERVEPSTLDRISERDLARVADTKTPQGALAVVRREAPDRGVLRSEGILLALDGIADPGNVGTLVRAADAFGARAVIAGPGTADFENSKTLRAAMGSTFHLPLLPVIDLAATLGELRRAGTVILAAVLDGEDLYSLPALGPKAVIVLGNEARGVSGEILAIADRGVTVPCPGRAESLNVAMAGAIVLSRLARVTGGGA